MGKFSKPAKSDDDLIAQLIARKLQIDHRDKVKSYLAHIGYYRLSGYMHPFLKADGTKDFNDGSHFTTILDHYVFDKKLRYVLLDMCERIEVSVRTNICNTMAMKHGPHWYTDPAHFRNFDRHQEFLKEVEEYCQESHDPFIRHYLSTYNDPPLPPIWMIIQILTFGQVSRLYDNLRASAERSQIAYMYDTYPGPFESWLKSVNFVRNCCAHHSRVWNRHIPQKPIIPTAEKHRFLVTVDEDTNKKIFGTISCMLWMLNKINPTSSCKKRLKDLFKEYPIIILKEMGFTSDWQESKVWKD